MNEAVSGAGELAALGFLGAVCWAISTLAAGGGALTFLPTASWLIEPQLIPPLLAIASDAERAAVRQLFAMVTCRWSRGGAKGSRKGARCGRERDALLPWRGASEHGSRWSRGAR